MNRREPIDDLCRSQQNKRQREANRKRRNLFLTGLDDRLSMWPGCWMCGGEWTDVEHVIPLSRGGSWLPSNLRPACSSCNASKGNRDWRVFQPYRVKPALP